jgi:hypothetical protein
MTSDESQRHAPRFTIRVAGLTIPNERRAEFEELVEKMGDMADSLRYLDPLDEGLSVIFDPRV